MTSYRLVGSPVTDIDLVLIRGADRITRADGTLWLEASSENAAALRCGLARAGIGIVAEAAPGPRSDLVPSIGSGLAPANEPSIEVVSLRRLSLAEATRLALGSRALRRLVPAYRVARESACRELLRGDDELAWWERRAWLAAGALRQSSVRRTFRPIVFDRAALGSSRFGGPVNAQAGALTKWAFG